VAHPSFKDNEAMNTLNPARKNIDSLNEYLKALSRDTDLKNMDDYQSI